MFVFVDLLRAAAFLAVLVFHFAAERGMRGAPVNYSMTYGHFSVAAVSVAVFFILSGFGLMLGAEKKKSFSAAEFYKKRFLKIMIPYYLVSLLYFVFLFLRQKGWPFDPAVPKWRAVFLLPGMSSYLSQHGFQTVDMGIGEWFIGALVLMYLVFPLLRVLIKKWNHFFFGAAGAVYLLWVFFYPFAFPEYTGFSVKLFAFLFGMWAAKNLKKGNPGLLTAGLLVLLVSFLPLDIPLKIEYFIIADAVSLFLVLFTAEPLLKKLPEGIRRILRTVSIYEYSLFLVHHIFINELGGLRFFTADPGSKKRALLLAFLVLVSIAAAAFLLQKASEKLSGRLLSDRKKAAS